MIISNEYNKSIEKLDLAYQQLRQTNIGVNSKLNNEKRDNADVMAMIIMSLYLQSN